MGQSRPQARPYQVGEAVQLRVVSVPDQKALIVRYLGDVRGILTHWKSDGSHACPGVDRCPRETHRIRPVWKGYAPVEVYRAPPHDDWCLAVLEVTERHYAAIGAGHLVGVYHTLRRELGHSGRKEVVILASRCVRGGLIRPAFDIAPVVQRLYRTTDIAFDVPPPLGEVQYVEPTKAAMPAGMMPSSAAEEQRMVQEAFRGPVERLTPHGPNGHPRHSTSKE